MSMYKATCEDLCSKEFFVFEDGIKPLKQIDLCVDGQKYRPHLKLSPYIKLEIHVGS